MFFDIFGKRRPPNEVLAKAIVDNLGDANGALAWIHAAAATAKEHGIELEPAINVLELDNQSNHGPDAVQIYLWTRAITVMSVLESAGVTPGVEFDNLNSIVSGKRDTKPSSFPHLMQFVRGQRQEVWARVDARDTELLNE